MSTVTTLSVTATSTPDQWAATGGSKVAVVEIDDGASSYIGSITVGQEQWYSVAALPPADSVVSVTVRVSNSAIAGSGDIRVGVRIGDSGPIVWSSTLSETDAAFVETTHVLSRPGGGAWTVADIEDLELGVVNDSGFPSVTLLNVDIEYDDAPPPPPSIERLIGVPAAGARIGNMSFRQTVDGSERYAFVGTGANVPTLGTSDWLMFGRMCREVNATHQFHLTIRTDANNRFEIYRTWNPASMQAHFRVGNVNNSITLAPGSVPAGSFLDGAIHWAVWKIGSTLWLGYIQGWDQGLLKDSVTITHSGDMAALSDEINIGRQSPTSWGREGWFNSVTICRAGSGGFALTDDQLKRVMMDPQAVFEHDWAEVTSFGDLFTDDDQPITPDTPETIALGTKCVCPLTGRTATLIGNTGSPAALPRAYPPYTQPYITARQGQYLTLSPTSQMAAEVPGGGLLVTGFGRATSTNRPHDFITVADRNSGRFLKPAIVVPAGLQYIDAGDSNAKGVIRSLHDSPTRFDIHWRTTVHRLGDSLVVMPTGHGEEINNWPTSGDIAFYYSQFRRLHDDDINPDHTWIWEEATGAHEPPFGSAFSGNESDYRYWLTSYQMTCRVTDAAGDEWLITCNRHRDTFAGFCVAWALRESDGLVRFVQFEIPANNSSFAAGIPRFAMPLPGGAFALGWNPRVGGGLGYPAMNVAICSGMGIDGAGFEDASNWYAAGNGQVLDGTGPDDLELGVNLTSDADAMNIYVDNTGVPLASRDGCLLSCFVGHNGKISTIFSVDAGNADGTRTETDALLIGYEYNASTRQLVEVSRVSIFDLFAGDTSISMATSRRVLQYTDPQRKGAILAYAHRNGQTITAPSAQEGRFGAEIRLVYFPDIHGDPSNRVQLDPQWNIDDGGWTAIAPGTVNSEWEFSTVLIAQAVYAVSDANDASVTYLARDIDDLIEPHRIDDDGIAQHITVIVDPRRLREEQRRRRERRRRFGL